MIDTATFAAEGRVARLATVDEAGHPHVVPVCYATDGRAYYSPLDAKPKKRALAGAQARAEHPSQPEGRAPDRPLRGGLGPAPLSSWCRAAPSSSTAGTEWRAARTLLEAKYPQYRTPAAPAGGAR